MAELHSRILLDALGLPEAPRWRDGRLYFSDVWAGEVVAVDQLGRRQTIATVEQRPNGLGFLPDGRLAIVSTRDRRLLVFDGQRLITGADLLPYTADLCNDMVVDARGHAYVGDFRISPGKDVQQRLASARGANLVMVDFSHTPANPAVRVVADGLLIPNGMVVTPDGGTLVVAETGARRLTAFTIAADGSLGARRIWAPLEMPPDGICLDAEGCIWVATPYAPSCVQRLMEGGRVLQRIDTGEHATFACQFGGPELRTLFLMQANFPTVPSDRLGRIACLEVAVTGARVA